MAGKLPTYTDFVNSIGEMFVIYEIYTHHPNELTKVPCTYVI